MQEVERMDGYGEESYPAKVSEARRRGPPKRAGVVPAG